jgi:G3E family GTPase
VGIDGSLLKGSGSDVVEMSSGCICCSLSADLMKSLRSVWERFKPRRIFIEASGVADPSAIAPVLEHPEMRPLMSLYKIITVLDADYWEAREAFGRLFFNQLEIADLILLNKIDLLDEKLIPQFLNQLHELMPDCQVIPSIYCRVDPETLWTEVRGKDFGLKPIQFYRPIQADRKGQNQPEKRITQPVDASNYVTFSFQEPHALDENRFRAFLKNLPWEVFRMKGPVRFKDRIEMINFVGGKGEWVPWDGPPETRLAFIGWNINPEETLGRLKACVSES